jgi:hypothetical protein
LQEQLFQVLFGNHSLTAGIVGGSILEILDHLGGNLEIEDFAGRAKCE